MVLSDGIEELGLGEGLFVKIDLKSEVGECADSVLANVLEQQETKLFGRKRLQNLWPHTGDRPSRGVKVGRRLLWAGTIVSAMTSKWRRRRHRAVVKRVLILTGDGNGIRHGGCREQNEVLESIGLRRLLSFWAIRICVISPSQVIVT